jgi:triosephosphate isomerase
VLNLKLYAGAVGPGALRLGRLLARAGRVARTRVAIAPAQCDVGRLAAALRIPVLAQHVDALRPGAHTGFVNPESVRAAGARGSLVDHSEHPLPEHLVGEAVESLERAGLVSVVCARDVEHARRLAAFRPPYLAVEPPELIGGTLSVSTARPEVISGTVEAVHRVSPSTLVLCGAGIRDRQDVRRSLELGAEGVLVASAVAASPRPAASMRELLRGFEEFRSAATR